MVPSGLGAAVSPVTCPGGGTCGTAWTRLLAADSPPAPIAVTLNSYVWPLVRKPAVIVQQAVMGKPSWVNVVSFAVTSRWYTQYQTSGVALADQVSWTAPSCVDAPR